MDDEVEQFYSQIWAAVEEKMPEYNISYLKIIAEEMFDELEKDGKIGPLNEARQKLLGMAGMIGIAALAEAVKLEENDGG